MMPQRKQSVRLASPPSRYVLENQAGFLLRVAMQRHTAIFMSRMVESLTQTQFASLAKLHEVGPCSQNHLGRLIFLDAATIKGVVDRLSSRGFVTAIGDRKDRRRLAVGLTDKGRRTVEDAMRTACEITKITLDPLRPQERLLIIKLLKKLANTIA